MVLYFVALVVIGFLLYILLNRPRTIKISQVMNEIPPPARFETHWWGYGWRPWWRQYGGVPGFGPAKPLPEPKMPVAPKPLVV